MQHIDAEAAARLLDYPGLVRALHAAHRDCEMPASRTEVMTDTANADNKFVSLVAWASGDVIAVKLVGVFPGNATISPPQPSVQGLVALFSAETGRCLATADGAALTFRKTAADSALGVDLLARKDAETLLVVGAGGLAPHVIEAHTAMRPTIRRVIIWNRALERAQAVADRFAGQPWSVAAVADLDSAVPEADIVSCVTMATAPLVKGALLKPGSHVDLIGAYLPNMREADDDVVRRAGKLFVDTRVGCEGSGEIADPLKLGLIEKSHIVADLFELCRGDCPGRVSDSEITMYKNVGGGHLDLFTARYLMQCLEQ